MDMRVFQTEARPQDYERARRIVADLNLRASGLPAVTREALAQRLLFILPKEFAAAAAETA